MRILVAGLGLMGGSLCKALKTYTSHTVIGSNRNKDIENKAFNDKSIDEIFDGDYSSLDLVVICLYPELTENYLYVNASKMRKGTIVTEVCGIKTGIVRRMHEIAVKHGLHFVGMHPMAGKERGGYDNSFPQLYRNANFIITPLEMSDSAAINTIEALSRDIGAKKIVICTPEDHDRIIAYTSQLAHVVSNAYVKSPAIDLECGFSGGSFQDITRIATMNEDMWTPLFMGNKEYLLDEINTLTDNLKKYAKALEDGDCEEMSRLIREGCLKKEENLKKRIGEPN